MKHPGTFNANPLSAAAGSTALRIVSSGEPCRRANELGRLLRQKLNALFTARSIDWIAYGEFSGWRLIPRYQGPRPTSDDFIPYGGSVDKLDGPKDRNLVQAFRRGMLLNGVDLSGLSGMTMMAHTEADLEQTVAAVAATIDMLREEGLA
jgi:glutamate-1-semialdehyde 2,1-aminomutase